MGACIEAFRINAAVAKDDTQIHTHMCYCEFNDIMDSIAALDADVITIETSRSDMELLESFEEFDYPNEIGPGVYDIHSPNVPSVEWIEPHARRVRIHLAGQRQRVMRAPVIRAAKSDGAATFGGGAGDFYRVFHRFGTGRNQQPCASPACEAAGHGLKVPGWSSRR